MNIEDVNDDYIKENFDLDKHRKELKQELNCNVNGIYIELFPDTEMTTEIFVNRLNKYEEDIKAAYPDKKLLINIRYDRGWDYSELELKVYRLYPEADQTVINRLKNRERSKIRRQKNKEAREILKRSDELRELRRLTKKYKGELKHESKVVS